jgi:hypothetical protein
MQDVPRNVTRRSPSIPRKLVHEGKFSFLPVYYLLTLSALGREGIRHSGSHRFADHIYRGESSGLGPIGRTIDSLLLRLPAARALRKRCTEAERVMRNVLEATEERTVRVLAVPCGIPRDLMNLVTSLEIENPSLLGRIEYHGMDVDFHVLNDAYRATTGCPIASLQFHRGDALCAKDYPAGFFDCVISTGLGEFLTARELEGFHSRVYDVLVPGGVFFTSASAREPWSARLLEMIELIAQYRTADEVSAALGGRPWRQIRCTEDRSGLQTFVRAVK